MKYHANIKSAAPPQKPSKQNTVMPIIGTNKNLYMTLEIP